MAVGPTVGTQNDKIRSGEDDPSAGYLVDKLTSSDGSVTITETSCGCEVDLSVVGVGGYVEEWNKYSIDFDDAGLQTGTNDVQFSIATGLPIGTTIVSTRKKQSSSWGGASITLIDLEVGYNTSYDNAMSLTSSTIPPRGTSDSPILDSLCIGVIDVRFTFTGGVDTDLTTGGVDIWIKTIVLT